MRKNEIEKRLEELENAEWYLDMKDRWTQSDWDYLNKITRERQELRAELQTLAG